MNMRATCTGILVMTLSACASGGGLARKDVLQQYEPIARLSRSVSAAQAQDAELLAPSGFAALQTTLERAVEAAQKAQKESALGHADQGLGMLPRLDTDMAKAWDEMQSVMSTRQRADVAGAQGLFHARFEGADRALRETSAMLERGEVNAARARRPDLMERYAGLELEALTRGSLDAAKAAIARAKDRGAREHASALIKQASQELDLVSAVLEADRTQTDKANEHARRAIWLAQRSEAVTDLAKMFKARKFDAEDLVLWHQDQLDYINEPLDQSLPFNEPDRVVAQTMRRSLESLLEAQTHSRTLIESLTSQVAGLRAKTDDQNFRHEKQVASLVESERRHLQQQREAKSGEVSALVDKHRAELARLAKRYQGELSAKDESERLRDEGEARYRYVQSLFSESEAVVVRQNDDVLIQAHGFSFIPGRSEAESRNFGLLNKIETAIQRFPGSRVAVSGHTDSLGGPQFNLALSSRRAAGVAEFLTKVAKIPPERVSSEGLGESRPLASNETSEGRAQNRRIEVRIINAPVVESSLK